MSKYKIIFHLHDEEKIITAISNIINLIKDLGIENLDIELLMNGTGVKMMLEDGEYDKKVDYLSNKGIVLCVCSNSLEALNLTEDDLIGETKMVPSGVGELVKKQNKGWDYIKI